MIPAVMIDIETLDTSPSSLILSIGAVLMDMESLNLVHDQVLYLELSRDQKGRTISQSTLDWWLKLGNCPIDGTLPLENALKILSNFIPEGSEIWCKGADFDTTILANAYKSASLELPWKYNSVRDCRTIFKTFPIAPGLFPQNNHNAFEDAKNQANQLIYILRGLRHE